jgi:curved DNA-binding protein CbpA
MDIEESYRLLNVSRSASDEVVAAAYKKLAFRLHPDKNPHRVAWATEAMTRLNLAYAAVMSHRFKEESHDVATGAREETPVSGRTREGPAAERAFIDPGILTERFISLRESAKDALYRYFQYSLHNLVLRDKVSNRAIFNKIVFSLRASYHAIRAMKKCTDDPELIDHFNVFTEMIFNFYRASECLNILDSYESQYDVEAWRIYRQGDEQLHQGHKEIFYDRHNRGYFKKTMAMNLVAQAERIFRGNLSVFPESTWAVETGIKREYAESLLRYLDLFFNE